MKLKTKFQDEDFELGEVVEADIFYDGPENGLIVETRKGKGGYHTFYCASLKELNNLFEDYKEPKEFWFVDDAGQVEVIEEDDSEETENAKEIGNYFGTKEEAEKAVEKLKAWKRLKDKGFRFTGVEDVERTIRLEMPFRAGYDSCEAEADLDICFGGEE